MDTDKNNHKKNKFSSPPILRTPVVRRMRGNHNPEVEPVYKLDVILAYNKYMGGVDVADMMLYSYIDERKTLKFWKKVVFSIMSRMLVNLYILPKRL